MKLRNKKTGHIIECSVICSDENLSPRLIESNEGIPITLAELNEEWEDYEEPKEYWYIENNGDIDKETYDGDRYEEKMIEIGNYFETKEEAEKAIEKLKAWKRLKDKGFRFNGWQDLEACDETERLVANRIVDGENIIGFRMDDYHDCIGDLNICFGGEE